jgi:hypothetical protein
MFSWRVTKYNPDYRDEFGRYKKSEWTSFCEIGKIFDGRKLTKDDYVIFENAYIDAIIAFMDCIGLTSFMVKDVEKKSNNTILKEESEFYSHEIVSFYEELKENDVLSKKEIEYLARLVLREDLWCKLENSDNMFVHFGYDYYMYIGSNRGCEDAVNKVKEGRLYVETFVSPYNAE